MKYMLLIYSDENAWSEEENQACIEQSMKICDELSAKGILIDAAPLEDIATATSVRITNGKTCITDGPFAETSEQLGGYYIVEVAHLDEAINIAAQLPPAAKGCVEIRPIMDVSA